MIKIIAQGRLGNHLFQFAVAKHLAMKHDTEVVFLIPRKKSSQVMMRLLAEFNLTGVKFSARFHDESQKRPSLYWSDFETKLFKEKQWAFDSEALEVRDEVFLEGFFQSEKYFKDIEPTIRQELSFNKPLGAELGNIYREKIQTTESVSVHIRRGDYLESELHHVCGIDYFKRSIEYIKSKINHPQFFFFSDDISWCIENFSHEDATFVDIEGADDNPVIDLQLMSLCQHNIISNSSFSWWAAWLNEHQEKIVVSPNRWFNHENLSAQGMKDTALNEWVKIPA
ncbi:MAG: alpha-1,2-fucosyltransferase [Oleispira sp.]